MKFIYPALKKFMKRDIQPVASSQDSIPFIEVFHTIDENISFIKKTFSDSADLMIKELNERNTRGSLVFLDTMADKDKIQRDILKPLIEAESAQFEGVLHSNFLKSDNLFKAQKALLNGSCILFLDGVKEFYKMEVGLSKERTIIEPSNEQVIQGSHEGFIENLSTILHLIRKSCRTANLTMENITLGDQIQSKLAMVYMKDVANNEIINEFKRRVQHISMDHIPSTGALLE